MKKGIFLCLSILLVALALAGCGKDEEKEKKSALDSASDLASTPSDEDEKDKSYNDEGEKDPGKIEKEIFSKLVGTSDDFAIQENGVDIEDGAAISKLKVSLERDTQDTKKMVEISNDGTDLIAEKLTELNILDGAEVTWTLNHTGKFNTVNIGKKDGKLVVTDNKVTQSRLDDFEKYDEKCCHW